jgi:hypothetical protein
MNGEMEAGQDLDVLVARQVLGITVYQATSVGYDVLLDKIDPKYGLYVSTDHGWMELPEYSTDIAAAWALIERHPHYVYLVRSNDNGRFGFKDRMTWKCRFYAPQSFEVEADTAPFAICLAALKAAGAPNER